MRFVVFTRCPPQNLHLLRGAVLKKLTVPQPVKNFPHFMDP